MLLSALHGDFYCVNLPSPFLEQGSEARAQLFELGGTGAGAGEDDQSVLAQVSDLTGVRQSRRDDFAEQFTQFDQLTGALRQWPEALMPGGVGADQMMVCIEVFGQSGTVLAFRLLVGSGEVF